MMALSLRNCRYRVDAAPTRGRTKRVITLSLALGVLAYNGQPTLRAQGTLQRTLVIPSAFASSPGNDFGGLGGSFQQIYAARELSGQPGVTIELTGVTFRLDESAPAGLETLPRLQVILSTFEGSMDQLHSNPFFNRGTDMTVVFSGENVPLGGRGRGTAATAPFDIAVPFDTPFVFNPQKGQLVMDWNGSHPVLGDGPIADIENYNDTSAPVRQAFGSPDGVGRISVSGFITQFSYDVVPEPAPSWLWLV